MIHLILSILLTLVLQVDIAPANRVPNHTGTQCVWSAMETIARHWKMRDLYNLTEYDGPVQPEVAWAVIEARGYPCYGRPVGVRHLDELQSCLAAHVPVAIEVAWANFHMSHMVVVEEIDDHCVRVINDGVEERWARWWFDGHWTGRYLTICVRPSPPRSSR